MKIVEFIKMKIVHIIRHSKDYVYKVKIIRAVLQFHENFCHVYIIFLTSYHSTCPAIFIFLY